MITHPEKLMFPDDGISKGELAAYYETIAPCMLPHLTGRPITMERYHRGIAAEGFFQKDVTKGFPQWLERVEVPKKGGTVHHPLAGDVRSLLWLANQNTVTLHVWTSRVLDLLHPDVCVFDLDPAVDNPDEVRAAALHAPRTFTLRTMAERTAMVGDLWADMSASSVNPRHPDVLRLLIAS
jgi:bifunctional non-homologous end joining protein LigD